MHLSCCLISSATGSCCHVIAAVAAGNTKAKGFKLTIISPLAPDSTAIAAILYD
jgi:hypothetical protein